MPEDKAATILAREVKAGNCPLKQWNHAIEQWIARLNFAAATFPELGLPPIGEEERTLLTEQICQGDELQRNQGTACRAGSAIVAERGTAACA